MTPRSRVYLQSDGMFLKNPAKFLWNLVMSDLGCYVKFYVMIQGGSLNYLQGDIGNARSCQSEMNEHGGFLFFLKTKGSSTLFTITKALIKQTKVFALMGSCKTSGN